MLAVLVKHCVYYTQCFTSAAISTEGWCRFYQSVDHSSEMCLTKASQSTSEGFVSTSVSCKQPEEQHAMPSRKRAAPIASIRFVRSSTNSMVTASLVTHASINTCDVCDKLSHPCGRCTENKKMGV